MQWEMTSTVFSCKKVTVDGRTYCSIMTGQQPTGQNADNTVGLEITKITAEPEVFDQLKSANFRPGQDVKLVATLKTAAGGKSQPHIIAVVPESRPVQEPQKKVS
jgi:hypothetical protein